MTTATEKLLKARARLLTSQPFYATLALHLEIVEDSTCETMWTDGRRIGFSPSFVEECTLSECEGVLAHEVQHCALLHHTRRGGRDRKRWNEACDYAINPDLIKAGFRLPKGALINAAFEGLGAEEIFRLLEQQDKEKGGKQPEGQQQSQAQANGAQQATGGQPGTGTPSGDPGKCGEIRDAAPDHAPAELSAQEAEWKANVRQALAVAKAHNAGTLPGHLQAIDVATVAARVDWRNELRRFIDQSVIRDYSWTRPNRRHIGRGLILPGFVADSLSHLVIVIDDSGSIDQEALAGFAAENAAALDEGAADRITVIFCNAAVHKVKTFERGDEMKITTRGGGGTKFSPAFRWIEENAPDASAVVYFTDLKCSDYGDEPAAPVLWAAWGDPRNVAKLGARVPFGEVLHLAA